MSARISTLCLQLSVVWDMGLFRGWSRRGINCRRNIFDFLKLAHNAPLKFLWFELNGKEVSLQLVSFLSLHSFSKNYYVVRWKIKYCKYCIWLIWGLMIGLKGFRKVQFLVHCILFFQDLQKLMDPSRNMLKYRTLLNSLSSQPPLVNFPLCCH